MAELIRIVTEGLNLGDILFELLEFEGDKHLRELGRVVSISRDYGDNRCQVTCRRYVGYVDREYRIDDTVIVMQRVERGERVMHP